MGREGKEREKERGEREIERKEGGGRERDKKNKR
jgi:hypothetical protein